MLVASEAPDIRTTQTLYYTLEPTGHGLGFLTVEEICFYIENQEGDWCASRPVEELATNAEAVFMKALLGHRLSVRLDDRGHITRLDDLAPAFAQLTAWGLPIPEEGKGQVVDAWSEVLTSFHGLCRDITWLSAELEEDGPPHRTSPTLTLPGESPLTLALDNRLWHTVGDQAFLKFLVVEAGTASRVVTEEGLAHGQVTVRMRDGLVPEAELVLPLRDPYVSYRLKCKAQGNAYQD